MSTSAIYTRDSNGKPTDDGIHLPIIEAAKLTNPVKTFAVQRYESLGLTTEEAKQLLKG